MRIFKHKPSGIFCRLVKQRETDINTYLEVDELNNPIIKKRNWSSQPKNEQNYIISGFKNLIELL